jgi:hypothetical protein
MRTLFLLLAFARLAAASDYVLFPGHAGTIAQAFPGSPNANRMYCARYVALSGKTGCTKIGFGITGAVTSGTCGAAIYEDDNAGAQLAETVGACTSTGIVSDTVASFDIVEGETYRVCVCTSGTNGSYLAVSTNATAGYLPDLLIEFSASNGYAANACSSGDPDTTTGAITADHTVRPPFALVE